jgi:hypothetical protein
VSSPGSQSESTCGSPGEQGGGSGGGGNSGHPPEGQSAIQQQQGGLVGTGPGSGSLVSRTMTSSTPTYSSSPASWTLATPSDNSLGNTNDIKCNRSFDGIHYQATIPSTFAAKERTTKKKKKFFPTCITVSSFFRLTALSMRLVFLFYAQDIYSTHNVRCIHTHIVCYSADGCEHLKVIPLYPQVGWEKKATTDRIRGTNSRIMDRNVLCAFSFLRCPFFLFLIPNIQVGNRSSFSLGSYSSFL